MFAEKFDSEAPNLEASTSILQTVVNFYFTVICHLLVHNIHSDHDAAFIRRLEDMIVVYLPRKDSFLSLISHC